MPRSLAVLLATVLLGSLPGCFSCDPAPAPDEAPATVAPKDEAGEPSVPTGEKRDPKAISWLEEKKNRGVCMNNLRNIGGLLVVRSTEERWPRESGAAFLLQLAVREPAARRHPAVFLCPSDTSRAHAPKSEEHAALFRFVTLERLRRGVWNDHLTSYAGRNQRDFPLRRDAEDLQVLACDAAAHHPDGACVLYENGKVVFLTWKELGIASAAEFKVGPGGPKLLESLCVRLPE